MGLKPGDIVQERFEIEALAGSGGMGAVYRAIDRTTGAPVAVKVINAGHGDARDRFDREADVLAHLKHPGIVRYVCHGATALGQPFIAMAWLDGIDLSQRLQKGSLTLDETLELAERVATALAHAHRQGVVHRDVKPSNLFLGGGDLRGVAVLDFGIARWAGAAVSLTGTGMLLGTAGYMAPEQARGDKDVDARADMFALGIVLFECLAGRLPFAGAHGIAVLAKILLEDAPRLSSAVPRVPRWLDDLIASLLAKDPQQRPADAGALLAMLTQRAPTLAAAAPTVPSAIAVSSREQRFVTLLMLAPTEPGGTALARTMTAAYMKERIAQLRALLGVTSAKVEALANGSILARLGGFDTVVDQVRAAAQTARALRAQGHEGTIAIATGRAVLDGPLPIGEVIDRAASLLHARTVRTGGRADDVLLDKTSGELLVGAFDLEPWESGFLLRGPREARDDLRTLLGRATPCVGRETEVGALVGAFRSCVANEIALPTILVGDVGSGKSRVRYEFLRQPTYLGHGHRKNQRSRSIHSRSLRARP